MSDPLPPVTMTIDEAIAHARKKFLRHADTPSCGAEHKQLADWLAELRILRAEADAESEKKAHRIAAGHSSHCAARYVWGDGECECSLVPTTLAGWAEVIHQYAKDKGWWDTERNIGDIFMLFTSEVAEAYEEYRNGHEVTETYYNPDKPTKPEGVPTELADVIIRILDFCQWAGIDIQASLTEKHAYNLTRSYRHGGKRV